MPQNRSCFCTGADRCLHGVLQLVRSAGSPRQPPVRLDQEQPAFGSPRCPLPWGPVSHGETPGTAPAPLPGRGVPNRAGAAEPASLRSVFQERLSPTPLPLFIKRSRIYAAAITICPRGAAPASSFPAAFVGGRFNPSLPECPGLSPIAAGKGQHKVGCFQWFFPL